PSLAALARGESLRPKTNSRNLFAERSGQIDLMVLLLYQDLPDLLRHREFSKSFALSDAIAVVANGVVFILQIKAEHLLRIFRGTYWLGSNRWHLPQIIDLPRDGEGVVELLLGVDLELAGDVHVFGTFEH